MYLSADPWISASDKLLVAGSVDVASLGVGLSLDVPIPADMAVPANMPVGTYWVGALVDVGDAVAEWDEYNNDRSQTFVVTTKTWTVLAYLDGDCNREWQAATNLSQLEQVNTGGSPVNVVALLDRHPNGPYSGYTDYKIPSSGTDWCDTRWGTVTYDGNTSTFATTLSLLDPDHPEKNIADPAALVEFVRKAMGLAPAQHYMLMFYDHGSMGGVCEDDTDNDDGLSMPDLRAAFDAMPFIDLVYFDACLMQDIEVVTELVDEAGYVVASQAERWSRAVGSNINLDQALQWLVSNPNASAGDLAKQIVKHDLHPLSPQGDVSIVNLGWIPASNDAIDLFAGTAMASATPWDWQRLKEARNGVDCFAWGSYLDLRQYLSHVIQDTQISAVIRDAAKAPYNLLSPVSNQVIVETRGKGSGLTICLPSGGDSIHPGYVGSYYTFLNSSHKDGTRWREFLLKLPGKLPVVAFLYPDILVDILSDSISEVDQTVPVSMSAWVDANVSPLADVDFIALEALAGHVLVGQVMGDPVNGGVRPLMTVYAPDR